MFFSEKDTLYASFDYAVALLNYKASRESELDHHVTVFRRFYWLRERKVLWLSPNPNDKIQNGRISDCTPDRMGLHGMPRYYIVFETAIVYSEVSKFQLHPNSRPCDHSSITPSVFRPIPVLTLSGTFRGGRMSIQYTTIWAIRHSFEESLQRPNSLRMRPQTVEPPNSLGFPIRSTVFTMVLTFLSKLPVDQSH